MLVKYMEIFNNVFKANLFDKEVKSNILYTTVLLFLIVPFLIYSSVNHYFDYKGLIVACVL